MESEQAGWFGRNFSKEVNMKSKEQDLIDICFEVALTMKMHQETFKRMSRGDVIEWVREQLKKSGYPTEICGSSWGVIINECKEI